MYKIHLINDYLENHSNLEWFYDEVHLLKMLNHQNIMKFFATWVDIVNKNIIFVSEMFNSSLRQYRLKHRRVSIRTVKNWCRQILKGLVYLHSYDPPVIHRDLKCDNIFINGNDGTVKIGNLGLVTILIRESHAADCIGIVCSLKVCSEILINKKATALFCRVLNMSSGTPEFMAPELYDEEKYNELVDIYSFGMCVLEMVTSEYPFSECFDNAEIYKKVISGDTPDALYKVYPEIREFVKKCLAPVSLRLSAMELLNDPFLQIDDSQSDLRLLDRPIDVIDRQLHLDLDDNYEYYVHGHSNGDSHVAQNEWEYHHDQVEIESSGTKSFKYQLYKDYEFLRNFDMSIKGKRRDDGSFLLRLQVKDRKGCIQKIYFPFDVKIDSTLDVATEMVTDFDSSDQDVSKIADMIDAEISALIPEWTPAQAKYSQRQLQQLENQNDETYNLVELKLSQYNVMAHQKSLDSVTNNPLGCRPSVQSVPSKEHAFERAPSILGNNPSLEVPTEASTNNLQSIPARKPVNIDEVSFYLANKTTIHLGVPSKAAATTLQAVAPQASIKSRIFRRWKQKFFFKYWSCLDEINYIVGSLSFY